MKLRYTPRAKADLSEIFDFVAQDNRHAASRIIAKIRVNLAGLAANPLLGRPGRIQDTRELIIADYPFIVAYYCGLSNSGKRDSNTCHYPRKSS